MVKKELIRIVRTKDGEILVDSSLRLPGRGAYLHKDNECIEQAFRKKAIQSSLKVDLNKETIEYIKKEIKK